MREDFDSGSGIFGHKWIPSSMIQMFPPSSMGVVQMLSSLHREKKRPSEESKIVMVKYISDDWKKKFIITKNVI